MCVTDDVGFVPQAERRVVEQTNGILMSQRRLVRDDEHLTSSSASRFCWAVSAVMTRRLTGVPTLAWRGA
ncbi:hypothetical protein [Streptomyces lushanensis]|uniref:hypothetical protein n=1 Tax=Streptomyces lushanensis TaxID=1434255 RepID=UPI00114CC0B8|nr:hypothetical protein [Streptomyces lushanensis]